MEESIRNNTPFYGATAALIPPMKEEARLLLDDDESRTTYMSATTTTTEQRDSQLRRWALDISLWVNILITIAKLVAYIQTLSLSVLAAFVDSLLDIASQLVLNYTEKHSSLQRSSALYPAGASRLEPVGVLTCAALMGMASFEVIKESIECLITSSSSNNNFGKTAIPYEDQGLSSFWSLIFVIFIKLGLLYLCQKAAAEGTKSSNKSILSTANNNNNNYKHSSDDSTTVIEDKPLNTTTTTKTTAGRQSVQSIDPTLEALAQDHWNDTLSNGVAAIALLFVLRNPKLWWVDPVGAIAISFYIIYSWFETGKEQVEQLTGKAAPEDFISELYDIANNFDERITVVDVCRAYHFGPKFLVEIEIVLPKQTLLFESHDLGMELQYEIEGREEVERCFVHIDYEARPYDEHVVSKVPKFLREKHLNRTKIWSSAYSV
mmetsp:Transcript_872/g.1063  ORF Transcript_872/g.1063 Transcript_872/m.1063 type:complete len:435 (+) Transcript_872:49-1353(+)